MSAARTGRERHIEVLAGPTKVQRFTVTRGMTIGRGPDNDIQLFDASASRRHARLNELPDGGWELVDLRSTNGTRVDGRRIRRIVLADGMEVSIGGSRLRFGLSDRHEAALEPGTPDAIDPLEGDTNAMPVDGQPNLRLVPGLRAEEEEPEDPRSWSDDELLDEIMSYRTLRLRRIRGMLVDEQQRASFDELHELLTVCEVSDRRIYMRFDCSLPSRLERVDGPPIACRIADIAVDGARVQLEDGGTKTHRDAVMWLTIQRKSGGSKWLPVRVQWIGDGELGLAFAGEADFRAGAYHELEPERRPRRPLGRVAVRPQQTEADR